MIWDFPKWGIWNAACQLMQRDEAGVRKHDEEVSVSPRHGQVGAIPWQIPRMGPFASLVKERGERGVAYALIIDASIKGKDACSGVSSKCKEAVHEALAGEVHIGRCAVQGALACE